MKRLSRRNSRAEPVKDAAVAAARSALSGHAGKGSLTGARSLATGAVMYTAVRAAFGGARLFRARRATQAAKDNGAQPSLTLPNQRWPRLAAERR